ncbi:MAG: sugar ABC transporter permease [Dictyoglomus turgidum]|jgi:multiple sugar transport system permease protein|nr:MAG: sugar ABC transporter permease [Dictyoglomus turgidum]
MKNTFKEIILFIGPSLLLLLVFTVLPVITSLFLSITDFNAYSFMDWSKTNIIWFQNFIDVLHDDLFWKAVLNTFYAFILAYPITIFFSLLFAFLLNREETYFKNFFRLLIYLPSVTSTVAIAVVWSWILNPKYGLLNWFLGLFGIPPQEWLSDTRWAMLAVVSLVVWKAIGPNMLLFIAGLQGIPEELYEAAEIDGANRWQQFFYITLPGLRPVLLFVSVMLGIGYLQLFEEPYMLTGGGPLNSTLSVVLYLYQKGFRAFEFGYASSVAFILFLMIFVLTYIQMKLRVYQE